MKGFTLVELLDVIVVLAIIGGVGLPIVINTINGSSEKLYEEQIKLIENITETWVVENTSGVEQSSDFEFCIPINEL